jgi:hypothetical protein
MNLSAQKAHSFLEPLKGKATTFLVENRQTNLILAQGIATLAGTVADGCTIFDINALYSSNSEEILSTLPLSAVRLTYVRVPEPGSRIEAELPKLLRADSGVLIIDSLNTLYHLLSASDVGSRSRKLAFAVISLSYFARTSGKAVLFSMYRRERTMKTGGGRSIANLSDATVSVQAANSELLMKCERGTVWPGGVFSLRVT